MRFIMTLLFPIPPMDDRHNNRKFIQWLNSYFSSWQSLQVNYFIINLRWRRSQVISTTLIPMESTSLEFFFSSTEANSLQVAVIKRLVEYLSSNQMCVGFENAECDQRRRGVVSMSTIEGRRNRAFMFILYGLSIDSSLIDENWEVIEIMFDSSRSSFFSWNWKREHCSINGLGK